MDINKIHYSIKIFERGGLPYRNYTPDSLDKLFTESKTAANFEIMALIEGMTFLGYFIFCNVSKEPEKYEAIIKNPSKGSFSSVINYLYQSGIIDIDLKDLLHEYRKKRNSITHNWLQLKTPLNPDLKDYSYDEALGDLFKAGKLCLGLLYKAVVPSKDSWEDYVKRFEGLQKRP